MVFAKFVPLDANAMQVYNNHIEHKEATVMAELREASAVDAGLISRMITASWRGAYQGVIDDAYLARLPEEYWLPSMRAWLESGRMYGLIALRGGQPVGCVIYGRSRDEDHGDWGEIVSLYVLPEVMGRGIGSELLDAALRALHEDGYSRVYLWTIEGNERAERFYRRHGFVRTADSVPYRIGGQDVTDVRYIREG